ncbi:hypothetical protein [Stenotrophomonas acidaminiphila]
MTRLLESLGNIPARSLTANHAIEHAKRGIQGTPYARRRVIIAACTASTMNVELGYLSGPMKRLALATDPAADARPALRLPGRRQKYANTKRNRQMRRVGKSYRLANDVYYWRLKQFGTKKTAAEPLLTPTAEAKEPEAAQMVIDAGRKAIDKYTKETGWR